MAILATLVAIDLGVEFSIGTCHWSTRLEESDMWNASTLTPLHLLRPVSLPVGFKTVDGVL